MSIGKCVTNTKVYLKRGKRTIFFLMDNFLCILEFDYFCVFQHEAQSLPHNDIFVKAVQSSERFMSKKFLGIRVTGKEFFSVRDEGRSYPFVELHFMIFCVSSRNSVGYGRYFKGIHDKH